MYAKFVIFFLEKEGSSRRRRLFRPTLPGEKPPISSREKSKIIETKMQEVTTICKKKSKQKAHTKIIEI